MIPISFFFAMKMRPGHEHADESRAYSFVVIPKTLIAVTEFEWEFQVTKAVFGDGLVRMPGAICILVFLLLLLLFL